MYIQHDDAASVKKSSSELPSLRFTRVRVQEKDDGSKFYTRQTDFYHASHVDSYGRKSTFIELMVIIQWNFRWIYSCPITIRRFNRSQWVFFLIIYVLNTIILGFWMMCYQERPAVIVLLVALVNRAGKRLIKNFWPMPGFKRTYDVNKLTIKCSAEDMMMVPLRNQTLFIELLFRAKMEKMKLQKCIIRVHNLHHARRSFA